MPGETISCHFVLTNIISDDITTIMNSYWIDSAFTLELKPSASHRVSLICTCPGLACVITFLHSVYLWKQMDNKCEWDRKNLFLFYILQSWAATQNPQGKYSGEAMWFSNEELLSSIKCRTWTNSFHLTHICCPSAFTDKNCGGMLWHKLNRGKCKSDSPCRMQRVWVQE